MSAALDRAARALRRTRDADRYFHVVASAEAKRDNDYVPFKKGDRRKQDFDFYGANPAEAKRKAMEWFARNSDVWINARVERVSEWVRGRKVPVRDDDYGTPVYRVGDVVIYNKGGRFLIVHERKGTVEEKGTRKEAVERAHFITGSPRRAGYSVRDAISKKAIAREAVRQLNFIYELLKENNFDGRSASLHSNSANNYMRSIIAGGEQLPDWLNRNKGYLQAHGWRWYG